MRQSLWNGFLFLTFLLLCPKLSIPLFAQNYVLSNWTVDDGLSTDESRSIFQDDDGFMWIATAHGLNKFDGYRFTKHRYDPSDNASIGANFINSFCKDQEENIWVNLGLGVVAKYDRLSGKFTNYSFPGQHTYIHDLKLVPDLGICAATSKGLFTIDPAAPQVALVESLGDSLTKRIIEIFPVGQKIYLNTDDGFEVFDPLTKTLSPAFLRQDSDSTSLYLHASQIYVDSEGILWMQSRNGTIYSSTDGHYFIKSFVGYGTAITKNYGQLFLFEDHQNTKIHFSKSRELFAYNSQLKSWEAFSPPPSPIHFAFIDRDKTLWICTQNHQLFKWVNQQWEFVLKLDKRLKAWDINSIYVDDENGIWWSTVNKGIWRIYNRKWPITSLGDKQSDLLNDGPATTLFSDNRDFMWIGSFGKLYKYFFHADSLALILPVANVKNPLKGLVIKDLAKSANGSLWIATNNGILILKKDEKSHKYLEGIRIGQEKIGFGYVRCIEAGQDGNVWIGTTNGLYFYDYDTQEFYRYLPSDDSETAISGNSIQCISQVNEHQFLIGHIKYGLDLMTFNPTDHSISCQKIQYYNPTMRNVIYMTANTFYRSETDYWLGTFSKGLLRIDLDNLTVCPLDETLPIIPNIRGIQQGENGNLWVSSIDGIRSFNPQDHTYYRFTKTSGLLSNQFHIHSSIQDSKGNLYFGNTNGVNKIQPSRWNNQDTIATPILTNFKKYDERIAFDTLLNAVESIPLTYQDNFITFEFVSPTFDNPGDVQYAYQLEGFDNDWRYCENQLSATYTNLHPGNYLFKVRGGNKGGFLNSQVKQVAVVVAPPFWQTSWFALLMMAFLIFSYWLALKVQSRRRLNQSKIIAAIRKKTADDFHDELGHRLTKIVLFVESLMLQKDSFPKNSQYILRKIQDNANDLFHSTKDFIWAMNPSKDSALELFILLRDFGDELYSDTAIQFSVEGLREEYKDYMLDMDWKRQLILIFKEAMNNALKHSKAETVVLKIEEYEKQLKIILKDNGKGFVVNHEKFGYGLGSMVNRSKKIGGQLEINTLSGAGTEISIKII